MKYKQRKSESNQPQKLVEYLQGGIILRFNEKSIIRDELEAYQCDEFWFSLNYNKEEIENICSEEGFKLTNNHKILIK